MSYAAIYIPEFPALAWLRLDKSARSEAAAVIDGKPPIEKVVSFNRVAKELGLSYGLSKVQADTSGRVVFHPRSTQEEKEALDLVFQVAERSSPRIQIIASPVNEYEKANHQAAALLVDQSGTEILFGDGRNYAIKIREALQEIDFHSNIAVAPNAEASQLLARSYSGVTYVGERNVERELAPSPVSALRIETSTLATLKRWGIRNLGEMAALPETALISRIG